MVTQYVYKKNKGLIKTFCQFIYWTILYTVILDYFLDNLRWLACKNTKKMMSKNEKI